MHNPNSDALMMDFHESAFPPRFLYWIHVVVIEMEIAKAMVQ